MKQIKLDRREGMTLMEIMVAFAILIALALGTIFYIRPAEQFAKAKDSHRKNDLNEYRKIFESWLSDKGCYPRPADVCYNPSGGATCNLCSSHTGSPSLSSYTTSTLCDPDSPRWDYLYQVQGDLNCPTAFVIYTKLASTYDPTNDLYHCTQFHGCGPGPFYGYDYVVTSPNGVISAASSYYCFTNLSRCSGCGDYPSCLDAQSRGACSAIFGSKASCCAANPSAGNCP